MADDREKGDALARVLGATGRTLITAGVLILLFVVYQLWGTGLRTAQAQNRLEDEFAHALEESDGGVIGGAVTTTQSTLPGQTTTSTTSRAPVTTAAPLNADALPDDGETAGHIDIPSIGASWYFVEGVSVADLKLGPGHYPTTPFPGQAGNAAIAGHRTTYGAPFGNLDKLQPGDEIVIQTIQGTFHYIVRDHVIVSPSQVEVLNGDYWSWPNALTLTACHPKYSASQRIVVGAELVGAPLAATPRSDTELKSFEPSLSGERAGAWPAIVFGALCGLVWLLAWAVGKRRVDVKWHAYAVGIGPFLVLLFYFFENFSRLLPANY
jgi:sortase A